MADDLGGTTQAETERREPTPGTTFPPPPSDRKATLQTVRQKYPQYRDMADDQLAEALAIRFPQYQDLVVSKAPQPGWGEMLKEVPGGLKETLGMGSRPGAKTAAQVLLNPEGMVERGASLAATAPLAMVPGGPVARVAAQGALGAASAAQRGASPVHGGLLDATIAGGAEGILGGLLPRAKIPWLTKSIKELTEQYGSRTKAYQYATDAIKSAFDAVASRIPKGRWMSVPSIDPAKKISAQEAQAGLERLEGVDYEVARKQIITELNALDIRNVPKKMLGGQRKTPGPYAGQEFEMRSRPARFQPQQSTAEKVAGRASEVIASPATRAAADTLATHKLEGVPLGGFAALAGASMLPRAVPGGRMIERLVAGEEEGQ